MLANLPPGEGKVLINTFEGGTIAPGIALQLERRGIPVELVPSLPVVYGDHRSDHGPPYRAKIYVVLGDEAIKKLKEPGPRIAHFSRPLLAEDRKTIEDIRAEAERTPPGPGRNALLELARDAEQGPPMEIAVYLDERPERIAQPGSDRRQPAEHERAEREHEGAATDQSQRRHVHHLTPVMGRPGDAPGEHQRHRPGEGTECDERDREDVVGAVERPDPPQQDHDAHRDRDPRSCPREVGALARERFVRLEDLGHEWYVRI